MHRHDGHGSGSDELARAVGEVGVRGFFTECAAGRLSGVGGRREANGGGDSQAAGRRNGDRIDHRRSQPRHASSAARSGHLPPSRHREAAPRRADLSRPQSAHRSQSSHHPETGQGGMGRPGRGGRLDEGRADL